MRIIYPGCRPVADSDPVIRRRCPFVQAAGDQFRIDLPLVGSTVTFVGHTVPLVGSTVTFRGHTVPLVGSQIPLIGASLTIELPGIGGSLSLRLIRFASILSNVSRVS